ncbi:ImmA/IrrE family metallo-endopeptidase [uncultured Muribaculum sp.]|uniref:ImmA/IrrE family metallo-endopeptidase n=1 Tax=uncultured Muribaculum sp. TaxID=1918613 RepID=UPI002731F759|nr:ImmA/IrrE family metallo-endopeptidase [uncultured Muribaculum sp.]
MEARNKPNVLNMLTNRNTVGGELADIFEANGVDNYEEALGVSDLRSKEKLSKKVIAKANELLGGRNGLSQYLIDFQNKYLEDKPHFIESYKNAKRSFTILKKALPMLKGEFNEGYDVLDDILDFFDADNENEIIHNSIDEAALFRKQNGVEPDHIHLSAWLRRGEIEFNRIILPDYDEAALKNWIDSKEWLTKITDPAYFKSLPDLFRTFGVGLVYVPFLPKTVYGAVRWYGNKPLVEISDREKDLATCWYTLFHELGHVILHKNTNIFEGETFDPKRRGSNMERQANAFASRYLFNGDSLRIAIFDRMRKNVFMTANNLSEEFGVNTIFTSYWLRKAQYNPTMQRHISIDFLDGY